MGLRRRRPLRRRQQETPPETRDEPTHLVIGRVLKPHGVRGEMRVSIIADDPERFAALDTVYLSADESDPAPAPYAVTGSRLHKDVVLLSLEGVGSREAADALRRYWVQVALDDAVPLAEGEYFLYQLLGLTVKTDTGAVVGNLTDIIETGANNIFVVQSGDGEILIPDIPDVVRQIDFDKRELLITPLPGLL